MDLPKLKRSLSRRVVARLQELLPRATVERVHGGESIRLREGDLCGEVRIDALAEACHAEDRSNWGAIAGGFCNLVASRMNAWPAPALCDRAIIDQLLPALERVDTRADRLIREGTPSPELDVVCVPWLEGLRIELSHVGTDAQPRRVLVRDLVGLGVDVQELVRRAQANLGRALPRIPVTVTGDSGAGRRVCAVTAGGLGPSMLTLEAAHGRMFGAAARAAGGEVSKLLACAPRSGTMYFCNVKDKAATALLVGRAWAEHDSATGDGVPLSPRLFTLDRPGSVRFLDVGIGMDRVAEWQRHELGRASIRAPADWVLSEQEDGMWAASCGPGGPRARIRFVDAGASPSAARQLAERVRTKHGSEVEIGHGFFNGLPWAWVDTGLHEGFATASMFIVLPGALAVVQTEVPGEAGAQAVTLQKVIATIAPA